jgi:hypothetical protein
MGDSEQRSQLKCDGQHFVAQPQPPPRPTKKRILSRDAAEITPID